MKKSLLGAAMVAAAFSIAVSAGGVALAKGPVVPVPGRLVITGPGLGPPITLQGKVFPQEYGWEGSGARSSELTTELRDLGLLEAGPEVGWYVLSPDTSTLGGQLGRGLFGSFNVEPTGAEWYRSQVSADDLLLAYPATQASDDRNFWGTARQNLPNYRQTKFVLELMNGTQFGGVVDPRMTRMLSPAPDGVYRGLDVNTLNYGALTTTQRPNNFWGYTGIVAANSPSRYIFNDKTKFPAMTYAQLQFVKAEAAFRSGNRALALTAYTNGISSHIDFVNARNNEEGNTPTQITAAEKAAYLGDANIVPTAANLTMTQIMSQKYIAQWMWGFYEQWMDMRRFHYTDTWPGEARQVFPGFTTTTNLYADNQGKLAYRYRV